MEIEFKKVSEFNRGIIYELLKNAYSFNDNCERCWGSDWKEFDDFFFDNLHIADRYGFITTYNHEAIGLASWNPTKMPEYTEIGHNCIVREYKGNGYGRLQLQEAVRRIIDMDANKIIVSTNELMLPAQRMYESVGFKFCRRRKNESAAGFSGDYIDYALNVSR